MDEASDALAAFGSGWTTGQLARVVEYLASRADGPFPEDVDEVVAWAQTAARADDTAIVAHLPKRPVRVRPLSGKYYRTVVEDADGNTVAEFSIPERDGNGMPVPSPRVTRRPGDPDGGFDWSHHESRASWLAALALVDAINRA